MRCTFLPSFVLFALVEYSPFVALLYSSNGMKEKGRFKYASLLAVTWERGDASKNAWMVRKLEINRLNHIHSDLKMIG